MDVKGLDLATLQKICRTLAADEKRNGKPKQPDGRTESDGKAESTSNESTESTESTEGKEATTTYVFNVGHGAKWPETKPGRGRGHKKETTDA